MDRANFTWEQCFYPKQSKKTYDHKKDIEQLNILLGKYGLKVDSYIDSPTLVTYVVNLNVNTKINSILKLQQNFEIAVNDNNVRVYVDGNKLCIEKKGADNIVLMRDVLSPQFYGSKKMLMAIGIDNQGKKVYYDLNKAPHMLIAGTTGGGKSTLIHQILCSLIINHYADTDFIGIDPKGVELKDYNGLQNFKFVTEIDTAINTLRGLCEEMDRRYVLLAKAGCRDIDAYNEKDGNMRRIVCVIDEFADLMLTSKNAETYVVRLAQKARACGIHLIIATQRPTADVVTGLIKANIPTRIALKTTTALESRLIIDRKGAEKLNGHGDLLFLPNGGFDTVRCQAALVVRDESVTVACKGYLENGGDINNTVSRGEKQIAVNY